MAFPTTQVLDTFTGANSTTPPNGNWTNKIISFGASAGVEIQSNAAQLVTAGGSRGEAYWNATTFGPNAEAYATVTVLPDTNGDEVALWVRLQTIGSTTTSGYVLNVQHDGVGPRFWAIDKITNNAYVSSPATGTQTISAGDSIGVEAIDSMLSAYYKPAAGAWTRVCQGADFTYTTAGNIGVGFTDFAGVTSSALDNFGGGTTVVPGPPPTFPLAARIRYNV